MGASSPVSRWRKYRENKEYREMILARQKEYEARPEVKKHRKAYLKEYHLKKKER